MGAKQRRKGATGERELAKLLSAELGIEVLRNLSQTRDGGYDLKGLNISLEVKRQETEELQRWWNQTVIQAKESGKIPVLAYRRSRQKWRFVLPLAGVAGRREMSVGELTLGLTATVYLEGFCYWFRENWDFLVPGKIRDSADPK